VRSVPRPFLLLSFPRQGTDWFIECLNFGPLYFREFFNPLCTLARCREHVASLFGSEARVSSPTTSNYWLNIARPITSEEWKNLVRSKWEPTAYMATKEVFSSMKAHVMAEYFDTYILYRHRRHTFPSSQPGFIAQIYPSIHKWHTGVGVLDQWKKLYPVEALSELACQCAGHIACSYANLRLCEELGRPPIVYHHLLELNEVQLEAYLKCRLPSWLPVKETAREIFATRSSAESLILKEAKYKEVVEAEGVEDICIQMIIDLKRLDPTFDASLLL